MNLRDRIFALARDLRTQTANKDPLQPIQLGSRVVDNKAYLWLGDVAGTVDALVFLEGVDPKQLLEIVPDEVQYKKIGPVQDLDDAAWLAIWEHEVDESDDDELPAFQKEAGEIVKMTVKTGPRGKFKGMTVLAFENGSWLRKLEK